MNIVPLPLKSRDETLVDFMEEVLAQAKTGDIRGAMVIKFLHDGQFAIRRVGNASDLEVIGAVEFAKFDLINANPPK